MSKGSLINSLWIILTFIPGINWAAFYYIGFTAKHRKWIYYGIIYSITAIPLYFAYDLYGTVYYEWLSTTWFMSWIASIVHAFIVRKEYLIRLKYVREEDRNIERRIAQEYGKVIHPHQQNKKSSNINHPTPKNISEVKLVDINNDSEQSISKLPGIGIILAKKAIELRKIRDFESVDDFGEALGLKPHVVEHIRPFIIINPSNRVFEPKESGRVVDF